MYGNLIKGLTVTHSSFTAYFSIFINRQISLATMSGSTAGHILVYGGRGALGSTVVDFLKKKNYVSCCLM